MKLRSRVASLVSMFAVACSGGGSSGGNPLDGGSHAGPEGTGGAGESHDDLVVFTTKASSNGDLGGLDGADERCTTYAHAAGLSGTFRAWLSDSMTDAIDRVPEDGPWRILDRSGRQTDVAFADRDAWRGYPAVAIGNTEFGKALHEFSTSSSTGIPYTWTGTKLGGLRKGCHCNDWRSSDNHWVCDDGYGGVIGSRYDFGSDEGWTNYASNPCDTDGALLCFQVR